MTMPRLRPVTRLDSRDRALSVGSGTANKKKMAIGIHHFNRLVDLCVCVCVLICVSAFSRRFCNERAMFLHDYIIVLL